MCNDKVTTVILYFQLYGNVRGLHEVDRRQRQMCIRDSHARDTKLYHRNGSLRMSIEGIQTPLAALRVMEDIAGIRAAEAAPDYKQQAS